MKLPSLLVVPFVVAGLLLAACTSDNADEDAAPTPTAEADVAPDPTSTGEPAEGATPGAVSGIPSVNIERVFGDLSFDLSTGMYQAPDGTWLVLERSGVIRAVDEDTNEARDWFDISGLADDGSQEMGLLGLAFSPAFEDDSQFYLNYTASNPRRTVVSRFEMNQDGRAGNHDSEQVVIEIPQPFGNHNGGQIEFGPDGYLYIALGDGGAGGDPENHGQNTQTLLGSILRIDVVGHETYDVPGDNPFVGDPQVRDEIWAHGFRNPWRFSFDMETGDLWAADVGEVTREEINVVRPGLNYGWRVMEGLVCRGGGTDCDDTGMEPPIFDYPRGADCAITGGFVYRGEAIPDLYGAYVYGDFCSGRVWALRYDGTEVTEQDEIISTGIRISSFAQGNDGELYVIEYGNGAIYKIVS